MKENKISVLIPTIRGKLGLTLASLVPSINFIGEVIILDEGDKSIASDLDSRNMIDLLKLQQIEIKHIRRLKSGIGKARYDLIQQAKNDTCLFVDDDNFLYYDSIKKMFTELKSKIFVVPSIILVNNEMGVDGFEIKPFYKGSELVEGLFASQWKNTRTKKTVFVKQTSTNVVLFNKHGLDFTTLAQHNTLGEDQIFCNSFRGGVVRTDAISYHLMFKDEKREWSKQAEEIYRRSLVSH